MPQRAARRHSRQAADRADRRGSRDDPVDIPKAGLPARARRPDVALQGWRRDPV